VGGIHSRYLCIVLCALAFYLYHCFLILLLLNNIADLNTIKNYSIIIGVFFTSTTGIIGIVLGAFYYFHKLETDKRNDLEKVKGEQIAFLLGELSSYDEKVDTLLNKELADEEELSLLRNKILRGFESIVPLL